MEDGKWPEDHVLLLHDAASPDNLIQKFRPNAMFSTYPTVTPKIKYNKHKSKRIEANQGRSQHH